MRALFSAVISLVIAGVIVSAQGTRGGGPIARRCTTAADGVAGSAAPGRLHLISANTRTASSASTAPGGRGGAVPALPQHCEIVGKLDERTGANGQHYAITFRMRLPDDWNGRLFFEGGGGSNGNVGNAWGNLQGGQPQVALALGYAVVSQDSGHDNATNNDPARGGTQTFGFDARARSDFGYRSYGEVVATAKALARGYYGRAVRHTYYVGCSEGGREAMMVAQRFPAEFDGVLACDPGLHLPKAAAAQAWDTQAFATVAREIGATDPNGLPLLNKAFADEDLALVSTAVLSACDGFDGLIDGMVDNFPACTTSMVRPYLAALACAGPKTPACLSPGQIAALVRVFDGAKTSQGTAVYAPWPWDAGVGGRAGAAFNAGWRIWKIGPYNAPANSGLNATLGGSALAALFVTPPVPVAAASGGPTRFALDFDLDTTARLQSAVGDGFRESAGAYMKADAIDLSPFRRRGGRMIIVHGVSDPVFSISDTIDWWNAVDRANGGRAAAFVRLFAVPGMNHCAGGPATDQFDAFEALVRWVERGATPDRIVATARAATPWPGRTRPLCPYPAQARYSGSGSIEEAASFVCRLPATGLR